MIVLFRMSIICKSISNDPQNQLIIINLLSSFYGHECGCGRVKARMSVQGNSDRQPSIHSTTLQFIELNANDVMCNLINEWWLFND